jgi:PAS domain S-box-containing protein
MRIVMTSEPTAATAVAPPTGSRPSLAAEDRFARVVEASPTALVLVGQTGRIEMVNGQAERMFGYDRSALHGEPLELLLPHRFRYRHVGLRDGFFTAMSSRMMGEGQDLFGLRKDGTEFPLEIGLNPIDIDGDPMVLAGIIDVTARHEIERQQERQRLELERSNADLEEFAYAASHDLKAPLRAISHLVQWIGDDIGSTANPETLENLKLLQSRVSRMQMLLDGLLAYSRVGHSNSAVEDVDVGDVVREIFAMLAAPSGFVLACEGTLPVLRTHRMPIQVVLTNLIGNGLKHHDRSEGRIAVSAQLVDGVAEFRVTDDGPGVAPRFHDRIFLMFQTLASRDDVESSGIGLTIVKKKVQGHGGQIRVESAPPARGTTFVFTWKESA